MTDFDAIAAAVARADNGWVDLTPEGNLGTFREKVMRELNRRGLLVTLRLSHLGLQVRSKG